MNTDALSLALAHVSFTIKNLSKTNFKTSTTEIAHLINEYGFEVERHFYRTLLINLDLQSTDESIQLVYWRQQLPNLLAKPNCSTLICHAFDSIIAQQILKPTQILPLLIKQFKFNLVYELLFALALQNSIHSELQLLVNEHIRQCLQTLTDNDQQNLFTDLTIEHLHSFFTQIRSFCSKDQYEQLVNHLRKQNSIPNALILLPILQTTTSMNSDGKIPSIDSHLSELVLEMGYDFTGSIDNCRTALVHFGVAELKPSTIARILSSMIKTHSNWTENTRLFDSNGSEILSCSNENKHWNVEIFVSTINELVPTVNWKEIVRELDHPGFMVRDRSALILLMTGLRRALPVEQFIEFVYARWTNVEGQLSWLAQAIRYPDVFCLGDWPVQSVLIDCLKHPFEESRDTSTWKSLKLIECLLRIADTGLYPIVLDIFKHGIQRSGELIFLGLLQLTSIWTTLKQELLQILIPTLLPNSPNVNSLLNYMWNSQVHTAVLRTTLLTALADWYNRSNENEQQQRLSRVLEIVQDLKALLVLLAAQPIAFILDLACLASRRGYLKLDKWLSDKLREHQDLFIQTTIQYLRKKAPQLLQKLSKEELAVKPIANAETIHILLAVLQIALPSLTNAEIIQEIQTMLTTSKFYATFHNPQLRSLPTSTTNESSSMTEIVEVDVYFRRLYLTDPNLPPISVDEFLDILAKCKDSLNPKERKLYRDGIKNLLDEWQFYHQYPQRILLLTAQLFGGLIERNLFETDVLHNAFHVLTEGLRKPTSNNLWTFTMTALERCKARVRDQPGFVTALRTLPNYADIPASLRDFFEFNSRITTEPPQQFTKDTSTAKGPSLTQNANIRTLLNDPSYSLVRMKQPPEQINDKIAFTFNNLSFSNLTQKAQELKDTLNNDEQLWKWVAQYLVIRRVSLEHNFHSLYAGFLSTLNMKLLFETVLSETHRNIKILLLSDKQITNIPDRTLLKNLGHWLGLITIGRNRPILATDLEIKSLAIEAFHMGEQELLYVIPFIAKILESCAKSKIFQQPNPWLMGIMSVLAEMHATQDFKLNLKFEIEVLCKQLEIQLNELPIHHILLNKDYFDRLTKQLRQPIIQQIIPNPSPQPVIEPQYRLSDFKSSVTQSLNTMLKINPNSPLFRLHPQLKAHVCAPIEQAINESSQTVQRSLKVSTTAAETIVRKDFLTNPDEQQLRTSARNMVAYLSSGLVLITARSSLQEQIQTCIKNHFHSILGDQANELILQTANEIATTNIELCCCLLQRMTIRRAIFLIDQQLANDIELRQRCRAEGRQLPNINDNNYGPFSSHQLAIYEDFVHYIPGFKPNDNEKRDLVAIDDNVPSIWDRLINELEQAIRNQTFPVAYQRLFDAVNALHSSLHNQTLTANSQVALTNLLNIILFNLLENFTRQEETFKTLHISVLKVLIDTRLPLTFINKHFTKSWLDCSNDIRFNIFAVSSLIRDHLLDIRQIDNHLAQLIDNGHNSALSFAVNFIRTCMIEQPCCSDSDIPHILESLHRISLIGKQPAEAVRDLLEIIRLNYTTDSTDRLAILSLSVISNGMKYLSIDDVDTTKSKLILNEWINLTTTTQANRSIQQQTFAEFFNQMTQHVNIFRTEETIAKFLRLTIQLCVSNVYELIRQTPQQYIRCHQTIDSLCRFLYFLTVQTSDSNNFGTRIRLINCILGLLAAICFLDHEERADQFHPLAYQRILLNLFQDSITIEHSTNNDQVLYYIYLAFTNCLHLLRPQRVTGFAFAWLEIVAHRTLMSRYLLTNNRYIRQIQNMYALLLVDSLRLVAPFLRSGESTQSFQVYYKGILKTFMLLLHDFPEFLCEHYYEFCDALPLISHQLRNIILSSFPKHIRCPDPFKVNIKIDMLNDISTTPIISYNYSMNIQPTKFKTNLDSYLRTRAPVTFLSELRSYLQQGADPGSKYNVRMMNALVLYVATQALATVSNKQPLTSSITHTAHMDIFQNLAVDLDTEGRYLFLNAMANHLRYPNTHTHYFSYTILYLFAEANSEALQEQIVRVLLERLVANRPHPWGLLVTFLELVRNPNLKLWTREFMSISPDVKRLLATLTHGFPQFSNSSTSVQQPTIVKP